MRHLLKLSVSVLLISGCTTTPNDSSNLLPGEAAAALPLEAQSSKLQAVATTDIGVPAQYTDPASGETVELIVKSEYFSANGRSCRRFSEQVSGEVRNGVSCQDSKKGWIELPLASYLR